VPQSVLCSMRRRTENNLTRLEGELSHSEFSARQGAFEQAVSTARQHAADSYIRATTRGATTGFRIELRCAASEGDAVMQAILALPAMAAAS